MQKEAVAQINKLTGVLKGISDQPSAQAAAPKVDAIVANMKKLKQQADALPKPDSNEQRALSSAHGKEFRDAIDGLGKEMLRIGLIDPQLLAPISEGMKELEGNIVTSTP